MSRPKDKDEAIAYEAIMRAINELIPTTDYMQAENRATMADRRAKEEYGESDGELSDLRSLRDNVLDDAAALAHSLARLQRWMRDEPEPLTAEATGIMAAFDGPLNDLAALNIKLANQ